MFTVVEFPEGEYVVCSKTKCSQNLQGSPRKTGQDYINNQMYEEPVHIYQTNWPGPYQ